MRYGDIAKLRARPPIPNVVKIAGNGNPFGPFLDQPISRAMISLDFPTRSEGH